VVKEDLVLDMLNIVEVLGRLLRYDDQVVIYERDAPADFPIPKMISWEDFKELIKPRFESGGDLDQDQW